MTQNNFLIADTIETLSLDSGAGDIKQGFDLRFVYNYYVQDEAEISAFESSLVNAFGDQYSITDDISDFESRPPTFIEPGRIENFPRYVTISLPQFNGLSTFIYSNEADGLIDAVEFSLEQTLDGAQNIVRRLGTDFADNINFEESLSVGLVDFRLQISNSNRKSKNIVERASEATNFNNFSALSVLLPDQATGKMKDRILSGLNNSSTPVSALNSLEKAFKQLLTNASIDLDPSASSAVQSAFTRNGNTVLDTIQSLATEVSLDLDSINDGVVEVLQRDFDVDVIPSDMPAEDFIALADSILGTMIFGYIPLGYLIKRTEIETGESVYLDIVSQGTREFADLSVRYGNSYRYEIRKLFDVTAKSSLNEEPVRFLFASSPIPSSSGNTIDATVVTRPEETPGIEFIRKGSDLIMHWHMPIMQHPVQITRYAIFERDQVSQSYRLVRVNSAFNDLGFEQVQNGVGELRNETNVQKPSLCFYRYKNFDFANGKQLAVISIDAHGQLSNYSAQYQVKENRSQGLKLDVRLIAGSRAPLQYPNYFLKKQFGGFTTVSKSEGPESNLVDSSINHSGAKSIQIIPSFGIGSLGFARPPAAVMTQITRENRVQSVDGKTIVPVKTNPSTNQRITMNVISLTDEAVSNVDIVFAT